MVGKPEPKPRKRRWLRRLIVRTALALAIVLALSTMAALLTHQGRVALKSAGFFIEIFPHSPVYPMRWFIDAADVSIVTFPSVGGDVNGHLYLPQGEGPHGAVILYIGVGPEHENEHVVRVSHAFARAGVAVLIPVSEAMTDFRVEAGEEEVAVAAFQYLHGRTDIDPERIGFLGLSVGGSVSVLAAQDPRIAADVQVVDSFGGYYDGYAYLQALVLRRIPTDDGWQTWHPAAVTRNVFRATLVGALPQEDQRAVWPLFDPRAFHIPNGLSDEGQAAAELLVNRDPERMPELIERLPPAWHDYLRAISPATNVDRLQADLLLMHDQGDNIVPYSESQRFFADADGAGRAVHLTVLDSFRHVEPQADDLPGLVADGARLYLHVYRLLIRLA
jgi:acetyl esterase/lipase